MKCSHPGHPLPQRLSVLGLCAFRSRTVIIETLVTSLVLLM